MIVFHVSSTYKDFDDFEPWSAFRLIVTTNLPVLIKMDMLSKLVRSGIVPLNRKEPISGKSSLQILSHQELPFFELVLTEYSRLIYSENLHFSSEFRRRLFILTQFPIDNPLALVKYMVHDYASQTDPSKTIYQKFNLDVRYRLDCDKTAFEDNWTAPLQNWISQTLSFRQILKILDIYPLNRAFGLVYKYDFAELEEQIESYPVISWGAYLDDPLGYNESYIQHEHSNCFNRIQIR